VASGDRVATLIASSVCAVCAVLAVVGMGVYALDWIQLRPQVNPKLSERWNVVAAWSLLRLTLVGAGFAMASIAAFRTTRRISREAAAEAKPSSMLVTGTKGGSLPQPAGRPATTAAD
jgi:hypothetical protein